MIRLSRGVFHQIGSHWEHVACSVRPGRSAGRLGAVTLALDAVTKRIDAVGMESHGFSVDNVIDGIKMAVKLGTDRPRVLRQVILACRKGGRVSVPGVYGGVADKFPIGALMEKGLSVKSGQTHVQKYTKSLLQMILDGKIDTPFLISHRLPLEEAATGYKLFKEQQNEVTKVVLKPGTMSIN